MSYKHLDQIRDLYESVNDIENRDDELTNEVISVISTSMFVEGYTSVAIKNYFDCADPVEIFEKYEEYSKDFLFVDEKTLNESVEYDFVLKEESIKELNLIIEGIGGFIKKGLKKIAAPHMGSMKAGARKILKSTNPVMQKIYGVTDKAKNKIKNVSIKSKSNILGPDGNPLTKTKSVKDVKDTVSKAVKATKDTSSKAVKATKEKLGKNPLTTTALAGLVGFGAGVGSSGGNKETKSTSTPKGSDTKKPETDTKKPEVKKDTGLSFGDAIKAAQTDAGKKIIKSVTTPKEKPAPSKPSTASGKETPKPRAIGKGKGEINPNSARGRMIAKNQERFGKDRIQKLRDKNAAFQAARKKGTGYSMDDFVKDFPDSNTAKDRAKRKKTPSVMDYESYVPYEPYDLVLEYLLSTEQADTIEEANYIMTEMDAETIQSIVSDFN